MMNKQNGFLSPCQHSINSIYSCLFNENAYHRINKQKIVKYNKIKNLTISNKYLIFVQVGAHKCSKQADEKEQFILKLYSFSQNTTRFSDINPGQAQPLQEIKISSFFFLKGYILDRPPHTLIARMSIALHKVHRRFSL